MTAEEKRLEEARTRNAHWRRWGPYLSERQWGTVREDYSADGEAWEYLIFDQAHFRAYRWGEDGIAGICDNHQRLCFAVSFWNGKDPLLKERLFGLAGHEGNHGEDVKEYFFYLDNTPSHAYMKYLYKYPQAAFPYARIREENRNRSRRDPEFELLDTGIFEENRYWDVFVEYAKNSPDDVLIQLTLVNRGPEEAQLHLLPTLWFRNTWTWGRDPQKPTLKAVQKNLVEAVHKTLGRRYFYVEDEAELLFTENETNFKQLYNVVNPSPYTKDGINDYIVHDRRSAVNSRQIGTKMAAHYVLKIPAGQSKVVRLRLSDCTDLTAAFGDKFEKIFKIRRKEADDFYKRVCPFASTPELSAIQRQAFAGMLWNKQFYHYIVEDWLEGDPGQPAPPEAHRHGRNHGWPHFYSEDILSVPDKWEYSWFASWDLAFHTIPLAMIDPDYAKKQLLLLTREWYMHPNGQLPAYEWNFNDVNPPVHAWAALRVFRIERKMYGREDRLFLERVFQKLLLNFTWWVNRKDSKGNNVFEAGFLGLDNIGVFDRSMGLPSGGLLEQADATSWMGMYCLNMLAIALELAPQDRSYEDIASKFLNHFLYIANAMNQLGDETERIWDEEDGFYYDLLNLPDGKHLPLKIRSLVGLIPLFAVETLDPEILQAVPEFKRRLDWFIQNRPDLRKNVACMETPGCLGRRLLAIVDKNKLARILEKMLDENNFLSPYGIRSLSKIYAQQPYVFNLDGQQFTLDYEPAESTTGLFGGNSNWRGPVWFPSNYLLIESLQKFHYYFGDDFTVEFPTGSGEKKHLWDISIELSHRLLQIFLKKTDDSRPVYGDAEKFQQDPYWKDYLLFFEYFHGDKGVGLGASHQTGWTGLVVKLIQQRLEYCPLPSTNGSREEAPPENEMDSQITIRPTER